ncbi:hypothetical protein J1614_011980 [Plenodomus biglobosus]|nr:hypothetical protein J1614_011980 [Plenodomus biglobosus]
MENTHLRNTASTETDEFIATSSAGRMQIACPRSRSDQSHLATRTVPSTSCNKQPQLASSAAMSRPGGQKVQDIVNIRSKQRQLRCVSHRPIEIETCVEMHVEDAPLTASKLPAQGYASAAREAQDVVNNERAKRTRGWIKQRKLDLYGNPFIPNDAPLLAADTLAMPLDYATLFGNEDVGHWAVRETSSPVSQ